MLIRLQRLNSLKNKKFNENHIMPKAANNFLNSPVLLESYSYQIFDGHGRFLQNGYINENQKPKCDLSHRSFATKVNISKSLNSYKFFK